MIPEPTTDAVAGGTVAEETTPGRHLGSPRHADPRQIRRPPFALRLPLLLLGAILPLAAEAQRPAAAPSIQLRCGLVITRSVRVLPAIYDLAGPDGDSACVTVRGDNITVDFSEAEMRGAVPTAAPDQARGVALLIDGGRNIRLTRARIHGYRVGILARGTHGLTILDSDLSRSWRPRLYSLVEHESLVDWLSFHHNEQDEWLRFGAAIYLRGVHGGTIRRTVAEQGMNGLLLSASDSLLIEGNSFSFNSGLGIGLYRASDNRIVANRLDFNIRGYSHRFYHRGQDSAGLLLFEQSSHNVIAWNSVTHGGDGVFLWAGQTTMDSGAGGSNDNLFFGNDFSFAATNAMEATFSRNAFIGNRALGSEHGLWGGYSFDSRIVANCFAGNRIGIAIEHGQANRITGNRFRGDSTAIRLWGDSIEPSEWGYPRHRETRSRDYSIDGNSFASNRVGLRVENTGAIDFLRNSWFDVDSLTAPDTAPAMHSSGNRETRLALAPCPEPMPVPATERARLLARAGPPRAVPGSTLASRDRSAIVVDAWGPYDWRTPRLWPVDSSHGVPLRLAVLGSAGTWHVVDRRGIAALTDTAGKVGDTLAVTPLPGLERDWTITLEYRVPAGAGTVHGTAASPDAIRFGYDRYEPVGGWTARVVTWSDSTDPRTEPARFADLLHSASVRVARLPRLDYEWYRPAVAELPQERWAMEATTVVNLRSEATSLRTISDDGIRVWVDGGLVIDRWSPHESAVDEVPLSPGPHELRVQYYQVDGWAELRVEVVRGDLPIR